MQLVRLSIDEFRVVKRATIDFGPGLNVLYGPNDLGKSTIAAAIRAALLVPPSSSEADSYCSWFSGDNPRVVLTLVDADARWWRVRKTFGTSSSSSAELLHSKDGITFAQDCKGRQVEEKLRELLSWGIPSPGGKGAPRGVPDSFLANVLLAEQTDTDDILGRSIAEDASETGKMRLTRALATLAQNPLFKEVLSRAQREVDAFFTESGKRKRGQSSPFTQASDRVRELDAELEGRNRLLRESSSIEEGVNSLRARRAEAAARLDGANAELDATQRRFERGQVRAEAEKRLANATGALAAIDAHIARAGRLADELKNLEGHAQQQDATFATAAADCAAAEKRVREAEESVRVANSEDAARQQALRRSQLETKVAQVAAKLADARASKGTIDFAIEARDQVREADQAINLASAALEMARSGRAQADNAQQKGATELEMARSILAFVRWRGAMATLEEVTKVRERAQRAEQDAANKDEEAAGIERNAQDLDAKLGQRAASLPSPVELQAVLDLERELERAEAALGGGISVVVRPDKRITIRAQVDDQPPTEAHVATQQTFDADRAIRLDIAEVAELDITAGSAETRQAVEVLRDRWRAVALPVLAGANVTTAGELARASASLASDRAQLAELKRNAERLGAEAKSLREQARIYREKAGATAVTPEQVEERRAAIGAHEVQDIEGHYGRLRNPTELKAEQLHEALAKTHKGLLDELAKRDEAARTAEYQLAEFRKRAEELEVIRQAKTAPLPSTDLDLQHSQAMHEITHLELEQEQVAALLNGIVAQADREVEKAQQALEAAKAAHDQAQVVRNQAGHTLQSLRAECSTFRGRLEELQAQIERMDRNTAELVLKSRETELGALPPDEPTPPDNVEAARERVQAATREHEAVRDDLNTKEGSLSHVGGSALREEVQRLEEARAIAEACERELEVDADAWKLLRDTLREAENAEGTHLGRALAGPVTARFEDLTQGRYRGMRLDPNLRAEGVDASGSNTQGGEVLGALSVGTRAQLAAILRLTIADQLRSTIVLDDHLVHTDDLRLMWFHDVLHQISRNTQIIVLTCRSQDYLIDAPLPIDGPSIDVAGGTIRAIDLARAVTRHAA